MEMGFSWPSDGVEKNKFAGPVIKWSSRVNGIIAKKPNTINECTHQTAKCAERLAGSLIPPKSLAKPAPTGEHHNASPTG